MSELCHQRSCDVGLAYIAEGFETCTALFHAQHIQIGDLGSVSQILTEHCYVNVFGNRVMRPKALDSEVPPLKSRRGPPASRPLKGASSVQQTQEYFSTF